MVIQAGSVVATVVCPAGGDEGSVGIWGEGGLVEAAGEGGKIVEDVEIGAGEADAVLHEVDQFLASGEVLVGLVVVEGGAGGEEAVGIGEDVLVIVGGGERGEPGARIGVAGRLGGGVVAPADEHIDLGLGKADLGEVGIGHGGLVGVLLGGGGRWVPGDVGIEEAALVIDGVGIAADDGIGAARGGEEGIAPCGGI